jgi:DNA-binding transcriptional MerR regulator
MEQKETIFSMHQVSLRLGLPKHTIRFWENEFKGILVPPRTRGGQRRYTPQNIWILEEIKKLREEGLSLLEIKEKLKDREQMIQDTSELGKIEFLASWVAEVVKTEVYNFLKRRETANPSS